MAKKNFSNGDAEGFNRQDAESGSRDEKDVGENGYASGGFLNHLKGKLLLFFQYLLCVIKLLVGLSFLTFVCSSTVAFIKEIGVIDPKFQKSLWQGVIVFLVVHFFVWEPAKLYQGGHRVLELVFKFFAPLVKVAPYVLPIYTILLFCLYPIVNHFYPYDETLITFVFLIGFSFIMHLVFGAKSLRTKQSDTLKANYIFGFTLVYIIDMVLLALGFSLIFEKFSFVSFFSSAYQTSQEIITAIVRQLLVMN